MNFHFDVVKTWSPQLVKYFVNVCVAGSATVGWKTLGWDVIAISSGQSIRLSQAFGLKHLQSFFRDPRIRAIFWRSLSELPCVLRRVLARFHTHHDRSGANLNDDLLVLLCLSKGRLYSIAGVTCRSISSLDRELAK